MNNKRNVRILYFLVGTMLAFLMPAGQLAAYESAWLEVRVVNKHDDRPISNAAVCLGTAASVDQFGASRSDASGIIRFEDLPRNPLLVTVSKQGFQGRAQRLEPMYESRVLVVKIVPGGGGPACDVPIEASAEEVSPALEITALSVSRARAEGNGNRVFVSLEVSGRANQLRISDQPDFSGVQWQPFESPVAYQLSEGAGMKRIYVQVRRLAQTQGGSIEVVSPARVVNYRY